MNAGLLLDALSKIGDHPLHVREVRKIVVALAVAGKLGGSSHTRRGNYPTVNVEDLPAGFNDPAAFTRLGAIAKIEKGKTGIKQTLPGPFPMVVTGENRISCDHYDFEEPAAIVPLVSSAGHGKASLNRLHYQEGRFALGTILAAIFPHDSQLISARFIFEYLSAFKDELLVSRMIGTANVSLSIGKVAEVPIPLVCPEVQRRVDELMALCDRLEAARLQREATRDRLAAASLARLNTPDPETFQADARFAIGTALPALTTRPDQIKQLRQTILDLAMRGKLTQQNASDEPAECLLERIRREKEPSSKARTGRNAGRERQEPFDYASPKGWAISTLGEIAHKITDGAHKTPTYIQAGIPFVSVKDFSGGRLSLDHTRHISDKEHRELYARCDPRRGDILIGRIGTLGKAVLVDTDVEFSLFVSVGLIRFNHNFTDPLFLRLLLNSPIVEREFNRIKIGGGTHTNKLNLGDLHTVALPIPPLAEQKRIFVKVDELMALCDQLETSLTHGENTRSRLLNALLHEALHPSHDNVIDIDAARQRLRERREAVTCRSVERLSRSKSLGRVRVVKALYFAEAHCRTGLGGQWGRGDFGPYDHWILSFESNAVSAGWLTRTEHPTPDGGTRIEYKPGPQLSAKAQAAAQALGDQAEEFERVLALLAELDSEESEIVATLYAAWNDLLLEGKPVSDEIVITEFRERWGAPRKASFQPARLQVWLDWMRKNRLTPKGNGPSTRHQAELI